MMGEKTIIDMTHLVAILKRNLEPVAVGAIRTLKGTGKNEGKFMLIIALDFDRDLKITVNVAEMFRNKKYFDNLIANIYEFIEQSNKSRFEKCRITG
jgi:hypothetical protein